MPAPINQQDYLNGGNASRSVPALNSQNPAWGNRWTQAMANAMLALMGWRLAGRLPNHSKMIIIGAPHTSNWDWILVMLASFSLGLRISWLAKHSLFRPPFGWMLRALGGVAVDRRRAKGVVGEMVRRFEEAEDGLALCITPEGTRGKVERWKDGFLRIAQGAGVPVLLVAFDYRNKEFGFGPTVGVEGELSVEMERVCGFYAGVRGRYE